MFKLGGIGEGFRKMIKEREMEEWKEVRARGNKGKKLWIRNETETTEKGRGEIKLKRGKSRGKRGKERDGETRKGKRGGK